MPGNNTTDSPLSLHPSNSSLTPGVACLSSKAGIFMTSTLVSAHILLLPVLIWVLYLGYQRRWRQCTSSADPTSPSDLFTYHSIIMQLSEFMGFIMLYLGMSYGLKNMQSSGVNILNITFQGKALFHLLTCVERYLAVVHPVTYLQLKLAKGVRITNICIGCVWLLSFLTLGITLKASFKTSFIMFASFMSLLLASITFCSISVLCALKRPGPGEGGGNRGRVDQSKQRAFYTIMAIMGLLLLRFGGGLLFNVLSNLSLFDDGCARFMTVACLDIPSSLVLPLLFLHRAGKLHCCT